MNDLLQLLDPTDVHVPFEHFGVVLLRGGTCRVF